MKKVPLEGKLPVKLVREYATHLTQEEEGAEVLEEPAENFLNPCSAVLQWLRNINGRENTEYINICNSSYLGLFGPIPYLKTANLKNKYLYPILDMRISFVLLRPAPSRSGDSPLDSETGWTGELWSNRVLLILEN